MCHLNKDRFLHPAQHFRIRDERVINIFGTDNADEIKNIVVQFLTKPTADATQENLLNRLERLIFQISMSANISDDSFGNVASGEAMAYFPSGASKDSI